jgi:hypothetical protein
VAASTVLLIGAGLLTHGIYRAAVTQLGFTPYDVAVVSLGVSSNDAPARDAASARILELAETASLGPIGATTAVPLAGFDASYEVRLPDDASRPHRAVTHHVTAGYFDVLGMALVAGRLFSAAAPGEVVINQSLARVLWPDRLALGRTFLDGGEKRVVGVVADAHTEQYEQAQPAYYDAAHGASTLLVRTTPAGIRRLREIITSVDASATPTIVPLTASLRQQLAPSLTGLAMAFALGGIALLLATVGTFGVFAFMVTERTREIGVRVALGARARHVVIAMAMRLARPLLLGLLLGLAAAQPLGGILRNQLRGLSAHDPIVYLSVLAVLALTGCLAMLVPARRALRVDPAVTLRHE